MGIFFMEASKKVNDTVLPTQLGVGGIADLSDGSVESLNGPIEISLMTSSSINGRSIIVETDVQVTSGVVHVIDKVLLPAAR